MPGPPAQALDAPRSVFILAYDDCDQLDVTGPLEILGTLVQWLGVTLDLRIVSIPGTTDDPSGLVRASNGLRFMSKPWDGTELPDILVVAGGIFTKPGSDQPAGIGLQSTNPAFTGAIAKVYASKRLVTSVCTGAFGVVGARIARGHTITTHPGVLQKLADFAAGLSEELWIVDPHAGARVVDNGDVITCGGVSSGIDEALYLVQKFWPDQLEGVRGWVDYPYQFSSKIILSSAR
jgi:transcriptional regulator GlxA family with amidase domain